jgi:hypothetical protein
VLPGIGVGTVGVVVPVVVELVPVVAGLAFDGVVPGGAVLGDVAVPNCSGGINPEPDVLEF